LFSRGHEVALLEDDMDYKITGLASARTSIGFGMKDLADFPAAPRVLGSPLSDIPRTSRPRTSRPS